MGTSPRTLRDYSKACLDILNRLRDAKIEQEIQLPSIVTVGIQSVGKTSVIESLSTLKLPRGVGTCTKCPMEFRLEHSTDSPPSVDTALRFASDDKVSFRRRNLSDLNEICSAIADAQEHILNRENRNDPRSVLTKVNRIVEDIEPTWLETFNNMKRKLDNGWFAVKLPAGGDIPWEKARKEKREFFQDQLLSNLEVARLPAHDTVLTVLNNFSADLSAHIKGISPKPFTMEVGLIYQVNEQYDTLRREVSQRTPRFCPTYKPDDGSSPRSSPAWAQLCAEGEIVYLDEMMKVIKEAVTRELPRELPCGITRSIIARFVQSWRDVAITAFRNVKAVAIDHLNALVRTHFADYERGGLLSRIQ
ncbi:hypothetical protein B0H17DRAFT_1202115 [Mycena rosella]|uniref:Dynamin GTPase domain-containing protein n=1 Tax=Mycena rosella TaxID=1033263 RepID=A0AAD7GGA2_MYCRO|nr:hypothetical protein B0H17DRAFT_1202115 [Mycena rosella]